MSYLHDNIQLRYLYTQDAWESGISLGLRSLLAGFTIALLLIAL